MAAGYFNRLGSRFGWTEFNFHCAGRMLTSVTRL
jgi:hypothetical protein